VKILQKFYKTLVLYLTTEATKQWWCPKNGISETCFSSNK